MIKRRPLLFAPLLLAATRAAGAAELREVTIPIASTAFGTSLLQAAKELGLFEKQGLKANIVVAESGNAALTALIAGSAQAAEGASGELIASRTHGQRVVAIADIYRGFTGSVILSNAAVKGLGVSPDAPLKARLKALDGLIIASPSATSIYTLSYRKAAEAEGAKIRFTSMAQPAMAAALETGAIQGMAAASPFWNGPVAKGSAVVWINGPRGDLPQQYAPVSSALVLVLESTAQNDRELVGKLRRVVEEFGRMIVEQRPLVEAAQAKVYANLDPAIVRQMVQGELANLKTPKLSVADMQHEIDFVRASGASLPGLDAVDPASLLPGY